MLSPSFAKMSVVVSLTKRCCSRQHHPNGSSQRRAIVTPFPTGLAYAHHQFVQQQRRYTTSARLSTLLKSIENPTSSDSAVGDACEEMANLAKETEGMEMNEIIGRLANAIASTDRSKDPRIIFQLCRVAGNFSANGHHDALAQTSIVQDLANLLVVNSQNSTQLAGLACGVLGNLAASKKHVGAFMDSPIVNRLNVLLVQHSQDIPLMARACNCIHNLALHPPLATAFASTEVVTNLDLLLEKHKADSTISEAVCGALWGLSMTQDNLDNVTNTRLIQKLIQRMKEDPSNVDFLESLCGLIVAIADDYASRIALESTDFIRWLGELYVQHSVERDVRAKYAIQKVIACLSGSILAAGNAEAAAAVSSIPGMENNSNTGPSER